MRRSGLRRQLPALEHRRVLQRLDRGHAPLHVAAALADDVSRVHLPDAPASAIGGRELSLGHRRGIVRRIGRVNCPLRKALSVPASRIPWLPEPTPRQIRSTRFPE